MISLKDEFKGGEVPYVLDVGDGIYVESAMPAPVADEVARRAKDVRESGRDGFGSSTTRLRSPSASASRLRAASDADAD